MPDGTHSSTHVHDLYLAIALDIGRAGLKQIEARSGIR